MTGRFVLPSGTPCELLAPFMPGVPGYHVLALDRAARGTDVAELAELATRIAERLGRERAGDPGAFTLVLNGASASRRPWAHLHIIPASSPAQKRRAFAFLLLKGPLRRLCATPCRAAARPAPGRTRCA